MKKKTIIIVSVKQKRLSKATVSLVIRESPSVKETTREKILEAIKELNYFPNESARSMVLKK